MNGFSNCKRRMLYSTKTNTNYGTSPQGNANFAWVQNMHHHLAPNGSMALLLANGSMGSNSSGEGDIRRALIEADLVECMVTLPGRLFPKTQIPACIWFLTKNKAKQSRPCAAALRNRRGETLFIDARKLGFMKKTACYGISQRRIQRALAVAQLCDSPASSAFLLFSQ